MTRGVDDHPRTSSASTWRGCRSTIATARRSASVLAINPRAIADARARDAERAAGRVRSPFHGVPIVLQGQHRRDGAADHRRIARRCVDHRPRLDSRVAAGMKQRRRRRPRQGQPRRVSVRRFRHQHASAAPSATPTIRRSAPPDRAAAAPRPWRPAWRRSASAPTRATRCRTRRRSRRWRRSARRAG